jgi:hypothetical protein
LRLSFLERSAGLDATPSRCQVFDGELDGAHVIAVDVEAVLASPEDAR